MTEDEFIDELTLDEFKLDRQAWYELTDYRARRLEYKSGYRDDGFRYVDPTTQTIHFVHHYWTVTKSFVVINKIGPRRLALRKGDVVAAVILNPFDVNLVPLSHLTTVDK